MTVAKNNIPTSRRKWLQKSINQTLYFATKKELKYSQIIGILFVVAAAAVLQLLCTNKIFINAAWPRQQQMGILVIMMMRSDK